MAEDVVMEAWRRRSRSLASARSWWRRATSWGGRSPPGSCRSCSRTARSRAFILCLRAVTDEVGPFSQTLHQLVGGVDRMQQVLAIGKRPHIVVSAVDSMIFSAFVQAIDLKLFSPFI